MGHKNSDKVPVPHVVSMVEESIIVPRRPHTWIVRPRQWHIARGGLAVKKSIRESVSPDMSEGMVATPTFNVSHQTS